MTGPRKPSGPELPVLSSVSLVLSRCRHVYFHPEPIASALAQWGHLLNPAASYDHPCHFFDGTEETLRWIFTLDVLNHCFWPDPGQPVWTVPYRGKTYSGYWGLAASLKRAMESGFPITDPQYLSRISAKDLTRIFAGEGMIPLFNERLYNLREAGSIILSSWGGDITSLFDAASGSAMHLVSQIVASFPSFRDESLYHGQRVYFWKRAQILASDVYHAFNGNKWGDFHDVSGLTAFADYKLPQVLRELGIISYHPRLAARIDALAYLQAGSAEEVEIRAATVWAVERIKIAFQTLGRAVSSADIDNWLWQLGQFDDFRTRPYHRCRTIYY
jgi:hypothetical protein